MIIILAVGLLFVLLAGAAIYFGVKENKDKQ
jgi:hypothetical protein